MVDQLDAPVPSMGVNIEVNTLHYIVNPPWDLFHGKSEIPLAIALRRGRFKGRSVYLSAQHARNLEDRRSVSVGGRELLSFGFSPVSQSVIRKTLTRVIEPRPKT